MEVLDKGFVYIVDSMGDDSRIVQAARVSYGPGTKTKRQDDKLIKYLMDNDHSSPFEKVVFEFHVKCPIFVARQWRTYRWGSFNEISGRYSEMPDDFYLPQMDRLRKQDNNNRQGSSEELVDDQNGIYLNIQLVTEHSYGVYKELLERGLSRELARIVLPANLYTEFYWTVNMLNLFHFIKQRDDPHAQWEIAEYARAIAQIIEPIVPVAYAAFKEKNG